MSERRILIMGAAGRDFHVFRTCFRDREDVRVVGFTAADQPQRTGRRFPAALAGARYPDGIAIHAERDLGRLVGELRIDEVVFAYSDVSYASLQERSRHVRKAGAAFQTFDVEGSMIAANVPVIAVTAVRTGSGKAQAALRLLDLLRLRGVAAAALHHPMPYRDLDDPSPQVYRSVEDLAARALSLEELEEFEPFVAHGHAVFTGLDTRAVLDAAEREAEVLVWIGGHNDAPFVRPDLHLTVADALRPGHEIDYFPGRVNFECADAILINKCDVAEPESIEVIEKNAEQLNPAAIVLRSAAPVRISDPEVVRGKRVLVIEDGPTVTHGGLRLGAGTVAARTAGAAEIVDPRPFAIGALADVYLRHPDLGPVLPAMGYGAKDIEDLGATIRRVDCEALVLGTPVDLCRLLDLDKPFARAAYQIAPEADEALNRLLDRVVKPRAAGGTNGARGTGGAGPGAAKKGASRGGRPRGGRGDGRANGRGRT